MMTHSFSLLKKDIDIIQLVSILKEKVLEFLGTVHGRARSRLHYIPVN